MGFLRRLLGGDSQPEPEPTATRPPAEERERIDLRGDLPAGHERLIQGPGLAVVGESFHRDAIEAAVGRRPAGHKTIVDAIIAAEPDNPHDPGAVAVWIGGQLCGYLSRADNVAWRPVLAAYAARGVTPVVRADVNGGWQEPNGKWVDFGITLYVASPDKLTQP